MLKSSRVLSLLAVALSLGVSACANADTAAIERGKAAFETSCELCHDVSPKLVNGQGPGLHGVAGRKVAAVDSYNYSDALKAAAAKGTVWTPDLLKAFINHPDKVFPGTNMPMALGDAAKASDIVVYLTSLSGTSTATAAKAAGSGDAHAWQKDAPGVIHHVKVSDLPAPYATSSAGNSPSVLRSTPSTPVVGAGFEVSVFSRDAERPRALRTAPNGDVFVIETGKGRLSLYRNVGGKLSPERLSFVEGLDRPSGIAFYPNGANPTHLYVVGGTTLVRIPYQNGDKSARGAPELLVDKLVKPGGHGNRDVVFSPDNQTMYITIGSSGNVGEGMGQAPGGTNAWEAQNGLGATWGYEDQRAMVIAFAPDGKQRKTFATGLRNCVAMNIKPGTGDLYCVINERDGLGDNLVPDYFTRVAMGGFYGWPWYYLGDNEDPRHKGARPDLKGKVTVPDVLFVSHSAPLGFAFYQPVTGAKANFPKAYWGDAFVALHGSWNRSNRTGSKVVRVLFKDGKPTGQYEDFMTGLVIDDRTVTARPVGVTVGPDGALYVTDDGSSQIWRIGVK